MYDFKIFDRPPYGHGRKQAVNLANTNLVFRNKKEACKILNLVYKFMGWLWYNTSKEELYQPDLNQQFHNLENRLRKSTKKIADQGRVMVLKNKYYYEYGLCPDSLARFRQVVFNLPQLDVLFLEEEGVPFEMSKL